MNNEPVAWLINGRLFEEYFRTSELDKIIPLYTHPAKTLTGAIGSLSDEEIDELIADNFGMQSIEDMPYYRDFARAILRKAQEK